MKTFQQPLSAEEEACCIQSMQEEGSERAREARTLLIERNLRLVAHIAKKYQNLDEDMEDLISIGTIGLIKAVNTFDVSKKIRLSSYASKCIENELLMMIRGRKKKSKEVSLYEPIGTDKEGNEISLLDIISNENRLIFWNGWSWNVIQRDWENYCIRSWMSGSGKSSACATVFFGRRKRRRRKVRSILF